MNENNIELNFTNPTIQDGSQYILMVKHEGGYYVIHNDGTLAKVSDPDNTTGLFEIDDPMVWKYNGDNLYHSTKETGFNGENLAIDYFWRYLDPDVAQGYTDENSGNTAMNPNNTVSYHTLKDQIKINYSGNAISSQSNPLNYIGVVRGSDGKLRIAGQQGADSAAEIYFEK